MRRNEVPNEQVAHINDLPPRQPFSRNVFSRIGRPTSGNHVGDDNVNDLREHLNEHCNQSRGSIAT